MRRCAVVHVGAPKAGSTTIQSFLALNRASLLEAGFAVPETLGDNHALLSLLSADGTFAGNAANHVFGRVGLGHAGESEKRAYVDQCRAELLDWSRGAQAETLVFSSEFLWSHSLPEDVRRFAALLREVAADVRVLLYVREPIAAAISAWSTHLQAGRRSGPAVLGGPDIAPPDMDAHYRTICPDPIMLDRWTRYSYLDRLASWESAFPNRLTMRLFDPMDFHDGDLCRDFCHAADIPWNASFVVPPIQNKSLSWSMMKVLSVLNDRIPAYLPDGSFNPARRNLSAVLRQADVGTSKYRPSQEEIDAHSGFWAEWEHRIHRDYFPARRQLWTTITLAREPGSDHLYAPDLTTSEQALVDYVLETWTGSAAECHGRA